MPISPELAHLRARHANAVLRGDTESAVETSRALKAARLEQQLRRALAEAPPLTAEQRAHLGALLHPATAHSGAVTQGTR